MPSSNTITAMNQFTANTVIRSARMNENFSNFRGHIIPVDLTAASSTNLTHDLGGDTHSWRGAYFQYGVMYQNTTTSVPASPAAGYMSLYFKDDQKLYKKSPAGVETEVGAAASGSGTLTPFNTRSAPATITAAGGVAYSATTTASRSLWFVVGDTTTGTDITANPQIAVGNTTGLELVVVGTSDSNTVTFQDGNGLVLNGDFVAANNCVLGLLWDSGSTAWLEMFRRG